MWSTMIIESNGDLGYALPAMLHDSYQLHDGYNNFGPGKLVYTDDCIEGADKIFGAKLGKPIKENSPDCIPSLKIFISTTRTHLLPEISSVVLIVQGGKLDHFVLKTPAIMAPALKTQSHQVISKRSPGNSTTQAQSSISAPQDEVIRPLTAIKAAGYISQGGSSSTYLWSKEESNHQYQTHLIERQVNQMLEESATAGFVGDLQKALEKAQESEKKKRLLYKQQEQAGMIDSINMELNMAVSFNLGYQYQANCMDTEALNTYSRIMKNKQFTQSARLRINMGNIYYGQKKYLQAVKMYQMVLDQTANSYKEMRYRIMRNIGIALMQLGRYQDAAQSFEAVIEIKVDHQSCYNSMVCYFILGHVEKMKTVFTKMLLVRHYDAETEEDIDYNYSTAFLIDPLRDELRTRQTEACKYILIASLLIAPVFTSTCMESYDHLIDMLKDQQYIAVASEIEMCKTMQHLQWEEFGQAIMLLKNFKFKEKDLKAWAATNLSFLYFIEGDSRNAEKYSSIAVKTNRYNSCALINNGNCLFAHGDMEGAISLYKEAEKIEADCVKATYNIGLSYKRVDALVDALHAFEKLSNLVPNNIEVLFQLANINELMGNYHQSIKWLEIVNTRAMHDAGILAWLGSLHSRLQDESKALHYYGESHRVYPGYMDITFWLGDFYTKSKVYEKALPCFELAFKFQPTEVKWQLMVAACYRRMGQYMSAQAKYKAILEKYPDNVECLKYIDHMCTGLGKKHDLYKSKIRIAERENQHSSSLEFGKNLSGCMQEEEDVCNFFVDFKNLEKINTLHLDSSTDRAVLNSTQKPP